MFLFNASNVVKGGGIQVAVWFITESINRNLNCYYLLSNEVFVELLDLGVDIKKNNYSIISSPSRCVKSRRRIEALERKINPEFTFSLFGPVFVKFSSYHIMGFANGWISHVTWRSAFCTYRYNVLHYLMLLLRFLYRFKWLRCADKWIFETETARLGFCKRLFVDVNKTHVIPNNCSERFYSLEKFNNDNDDKVRILYFSNDYLHKGLKNIPYYAYELVKIGFCKDFKFILTIPTDSKSAKEIFNLAKRLSVEDHIDFIGSVSVKDSVQLVDSASIIIQMSYLETFSANYPEAMARRKPLIVSDFDFSREICKNSARYVDPDNHRSVAEQIFLTMSDYDKTEELLCNGEALLSNMLSPSERFERYIQVFNEVKS